MRVVTPSIVDTTSTVVDRVALATALDQRLYFAQVREDPRLEIEALAPGPNDSVVIVGSAGCTALSLLAAGAAHVTAVDLNRTQNHLIELKQAAVAQLPHDELLTFLGAIPSDAARRLDAYRGVRSCLTVQARWYWDTHPELIAGGVLMAGITERFIRAIVGALRLFVHPSSRIERMLACDSIEAQRAIFEHEWNSGTWRAFFHLLLNRFVFQHAYDPSFFARLERPSFASHFRQTVEHVLTELPVRTNYFLHHMLAGRYPVDVPGGLPPYLEESARTQMERSRLTIVDGTMTEYLLTLPDRSVDGFALSNIAEWLKPSELDALFVQVVRTARPNATLCFRNFVGWTEVPPRFGRAVVEDRMLGEELIRRDRSGVQRRIAVCRVNTEEGAWAA